MSIEIQIATKHKIATYPVVRSEVRSFPLQAGLQQKEITNPFQSRVPNQIIVGMVDSRAFNGDYTRDPFCFQKFGLISIRQLVEGEEIPYETLQLNRNNADRDLTGYHRFLQASGALCKHEGNMVTSKDWGAGKNCTLFMFDNVASGCVDTSYLNPKQVGEVQIELLLGEALGFNVNVIVYAEFENLLEINANKAVKRHSKRLKMEKITLNNRQLDFLASHDPVLEPFFFGTVPCDKLPRHPDKSNPTGYIVNTDPHYLPGKHWIALWTDGKTCEVIDSYALPLSTYGTTDPLVDWLNKHWKYVIRNGQSLQSLYSQSCGDYALMYLRARA